MTYNQFIEKYDLRRSTVEMIENGFKAYKADVAEEYGRTAIESELYVNHATYNVPVLTGDFRIYAELYASKIIPLQEQAQRAHTVLDKIISDNEIV